ncbi:MAG: hypothetical protein ABIS86_15615, partial [Streptosporangiaceae bacterium]
PAAGRCAVGMPAKGGAQRTVRARFIPSEVPGLTSSPHRVTTLRTVARTLASLGRGYLGGHAEITCDAVPIPGCRSLAATEPLVVARAVRDAVGGGRGVAWQVLADRRHGAA